MDAYIRYAEKCKKNKTFLKVFLNTGTMLQGNIVDFDEHSFVLDKCLIFTDKVVSISPRD